MARREIIGVYSQELIKLVRSGLSHEDAIGLTGVASSTFYRWLKRGEAALEDGRKTKYSEFAKELRRAELEAKARKIQVVEKSAVQDPKMALELLARKYPKEWARKQTIGLEANITGTGIDISETINRIKEELGAE